MDAKNAIKSSVHFLSASVAGPALVWAGAKYPGSSTARLFLVGTGLALIASQFAYFSDDVRPKLLTVGK